MNKKTNKKTNKSYCFRDHVWTNHRTFSNFNLFDHLSRQAYFSENTFGPFNGSSGVIDHIKQEIEEIEKQPNDLEEWIDLIILAFDGAMREGYGDEEIIAQLVLKQNKNEKRKWPDWRTVKAGKTINHIKEE